ncbi:TIGR03013 family XrtA/PEP-CTERM system glycosyltransferase [Sphingomonas sp. SUN039]|uniref:TIGR03013 family XrtA/PEP-CTERM system glycosyltransferase n=1 Tax=Sphingomonas sp. SUN039 TaxID=2937787 RepID=UPI002164B2D6|nr:TIGR03013 family XrtA/PEP-CTERM system glycosyltransferase [Sphingomonas sp. SUN039]UVO55464.1 TIGR03013 family PEP-CTERM/XrtA system glycosyltransferase [Sphingomonas sp. SUN039]
MFRLFKHYVPYAVLFLALIDFALLFGAAEAAWVVRARQIGMGVDPIAVRYWPLVNFAVTLQLAMIAVGVYGSDAFHSLRFAAARLVVAICLGVIFLSVVYFALPGYTLWRSNSLYAMFFAFVLLVSVRMVLGRMFGTEAFKRRVLVLGAGQRAARLGRLGAERATSFSVVGHIDMGDCEPVVATAVPRAAIDSLASYAATLGANEVVLALEERRKAMPVADLLHIRTLGMHVNEISTFLERETGRVDLRSINPSWLIFSDGFSSGRRLSSLAKRLFDIVVAALLLTLTLPFVLFAAVLVKLESKGPAFYRQTRAGLYGAPFDILKLRSMRQDAEAGGKAVWAEKDDPRITRVGRFIRKVRIDELPQVWTVLKGEMSFVGPRPERPEFVAELGKKIPFYAERHVVKPGITGWAQINYPYGASLDDARHKLEYDLYYAKNYTPFLDVVIILQTIRVVLFPDGAR